MPPAAAQDPARRHRLFAMLALAMGLAVACAVQGPLAEPAQGWWDGFGPVLPHDEFPADCRLCHEGSDWSTIRADFHFDHAAETGVPLEGAHRAAQCLRCHNDRGPAAGFAARGCAGCHEDVHLGQLGAACELCHGQESWQPQGQIAEHERTRFPLQGAHAAVQCRRCHPGSEAGVFTPTDTECTACHAADLARAAAPNHAALGWTADCQRCHVPVSWRGAGFTHAFFPLAGGHATDNCDTCHAGGIYQGLASDCASCHLDDYNATTAPDHAAGGFSMNCELCHGIYTWQGGGFSHAGIVTGCDQCHLDDYLGARNPDHQASGFPHTCEACHNTIAWQGAVFSHGGITSGCDQCHLQEYMNARDPDHQASGFPQSCEICHDTLDWGNGHFVHSFNISSGPHSSRACEECHIVPGNYVVFSCLNCHAHRRTAMDDKHSDVGGYSYDSNACLGCHPDGRGD